MLKAEIDAEVILRRNHNHCSNTECIICFLLKVIDVERKKREKVETQLSLAKSVERGPRGVRP